MARFQRATVLAAMDRLGEALAELEEVQKMVPGESGLHFLLGRIHKRMGNTGAAVMHFAYAMDLTRHNNSDLNLIKAQMESLSVDDGGMADEDGLPQFADGPAP